MKIYEFVDPTVTQMEQLFWGLAATVADQAGVTKDDALCHMRRAWMDRLKAIKLSDAIDYRSDGRAAAWRVRMVIWRTDQNDQPTERVADTDPRAPFDAYEIAPGETVIYGLPPVAEWALELITALHASTPGAQVEGINASALASKLKSLRVTLSRSGGKTVWRLRYSVAAPRPDRPEGPPTLRHLAGSGPALQHFCAYVYVQREERPRGAR